MSQTRPIPRSPDGDNNINQTVHTNGNDLPWEVMQEKCQN